ncbi:MAG: hypothetical protein FWC61_03100 [Proteobacteria bacterium]|nr:hypothetical protein [Pseudomonadota bacterium]
MEFMELKIVLAVLFGLAAIAVTIVKPGPNHQAIRAMGAGGVFAPAIWVALVALIWSVIELAMAAKKVKK